MAQWLLVQLQPLRTRAQIRVAAAAEIDDPAPSSSARLSVLGRQWSSPQEAHEGEFLGQDRLYLPLQERGSRELPSAYSRVQIRFRLDVDQFLR